MIFNGGESFFGCMDVFFVGGSIFLICFGVNSDFFEKANKKSLEMNE